MKIFKATITPTVSGGNIEVKISANSYTQAQELIKTLPYFKSFVRMPSITNEANSLTTKLKQLISQAQSN